MAAVARDCQPASVHNEPDTAGTARLRQALLEEEEGAGAALWVTRAWRQWAAVCTGAAWAWAAAAGQRPASGRR